MSTPATSKSLISNVASEVYLFRTLANICPSDDVNELLAVVRPLEGLPTNPNKDVYGFDTRIILSTFEVQWDNGEEIEGAEAATNPTEENKQTFKVVMDSIMSLVRMKAKN